MEIQIQELSPKKALLKFSDTTATEVNAIRRSLVSNIPKMAIDDVEFHLGTVHDDESGRDYDLSTSIFDEAIALRMGLLPVPTKPKSFRFKDKCTCKGEGCEHCQVIYTLDKKGPCTVYSRDLVPLGDPELAIADPDVPIVTLGARQAILTYATAVMGTGRQHAKWQVVHAVGFTAQPKVTINKAAGCSDACLKKAGSICPTKVFKAGDGPLEVVKEDACILCKDCEKACSHGSIKIDSDPTTYLFTFETDGSMTAREALRLAFENLVAEIDDLRDAVVSLG
ncbi:MAG: DNA-directed RNA polymerase subunit D [Candidatus Thermoplasmatota archaeon]|jgi:DNA-directed RNA polymerase subunit D|nr:DNA-directed RNA polymerase subunit D [Candidatus Thermoplasmatota archaeon]MCL5984438.1 DNA-directed RNA polymerase subunit D [Candidatus Thermoplasmatota archaeon]